jgi:NADH dehydrogenase [ubiquinone] 1 alpha subcomplex assembly factor 7
MAKLLKHLRRRIRNEGPLTISQYMEECLGNPRFGYYMGRDPFGRGGDFITAPEISQMFGELVGLWCGIEWLALEKPKHIKLVELGPGRGTLMADILRVAKGVPGFSEAISLHLVETSPALREHQTEALKDYNPVWHSHIGTVPDGPILIVANEFFDALPIRQFQKVPDGWSERLVGLNKSDKSVLGIGLASPKLVHPFVPRNLANAETDSIVEVSPVSLNYMRTIAERLSADQGAALIIDYGYAKSSAGDTFQAVKNHAYVDVLTDPGNADLTAHVDFESLLNVATESGAQAFGVMEQGKFLKNLGIEERSERLIEGATPEQAAMITSALKRLIGSDAMGELFKVIAVTCPDLDPPAGFQELQA